MTLQSLYNNTYGSVAPYTTIYFVETYIATTLSEYGYVTIIEHGSQKYTHYSLVTLTWKGLFYLFAHKYQQR